MWIKKKTINTFKMNIFQSNILKPNQTSYNLKMSHGIKITRNFMTKSSNIIVSVGYLTYSCSNQEHQITHDSSIPCEVGWWICRGEAEGRTFITSNQGSNFLLISVKLNQIMSKREITASKKMTFY